MAKTTPKPKPVKPVKTKSSKSQPLTIQEWTSLAGLCLFGLIFLYWLYRRLTASSRKYKQTNPYVATVDLHERYGGLEKRAVSIDDLPVQQLFLLRRDGKLNAATVEKLVRQGRLPRDEKMDLNDFMRDGGGGKSRGHTSDKVALSSPASTSSLVSTPTPMYSSSAAAPSASGAAGKSLSGAAKQRKGKSGGKKKK